MKYAEVDDLSSREIKVIEAVANSNTKSMGEISRLLNVTMGTLTVAINKLVKKQYVIRTRNKLDRRIVVVYLTDKGVQIYQEFEKLHQTINEKINEVMKDNEIENFLTGYNKINLTLEKLILKRRDRNEQ